MYVEVHVITLKKQKPHIEWGLHVYLGGDERIRTSDQSFSPDAPLAGECLRPARPRLRINAFTTPHSLTDFRQTVGLLLNPYF